VPQHGAGLWDRFLSPSPWTGLAQIGGLYLAVLLASLAIQYAQSYLMQYIGQQAMFDLRRQLMSHLQELDLSYFDRNPVGRLVTRLTTDVDVLNELFSTGLITALADMLVLVFVLAAMFQLSVGLTLLLLCAAPFVILAIVLFRRAVSESYRQIRVAIARINAYLQERVSGMSVVQLFNREERSLEEFAAINRSHMEAYKKAILAYGWFFPVIEFIGMVAVAGLLAYGGYQIHYGALTLGVLLAFFQYGMRFFRPVQDLSEKYNVLQSAMAASERVFALLDTPVAIQAPARPRPFPQGPVAIEFDGVWFAYKDNEWVIQDVSFTIAPGETIAIVGHTGAGKTTLISLLLRFYDVQRGSIRLGGIDVREMDPRELRRHFGVVLQDPHLFTGTIEDNIRLGTPWIEEEDLVAAAEQVNLLDYIRSLPEGFAHPVRERGSGFSTGQKQLISFARALAHNPQILILDEATSSVDTDTELRVRAALARIVEGRTSIIIAHRLSTIQRADRILVMHKGQLREVGTHQQLLAQRGIYWKLYQLQYQDQERPAPQPLVSGG
jgi:ATP-binding cassette subfamily B protein